MISKLATPITNDNAKDKRCPAEGLGLVQQLGWSSHTHSLTFIFQVFKSWVSAVRYASALGLEKPTTHT